METKKERSESMKQRTKVYSSMLMSTISIIAAMVTAIVSIIGILDVSKGWKTAIGAAFVTIVLSASFTLVLARRERGSSRVAKLKDDMSGAYLSALESSPLNSLRGEQR